MNEEPHATTEQLTRNREALPAAGAELTAVNHELKVKLEELSRANRDLQNMLVASDIAMILIDDGWRLKRYTPRAADLFTITASDLGRPLLKLPHNLMDVALHEAMQRVVDDLAPLKQKVQSSDGRWYLLSVRPYRTAEDRLEGMLLTFVEITESTHMEEGLQRANDRLEVRMRKRTAQLESANQDLAREVRERGELELVRQQLLAELVHAQEAERLALARDLHDEVVQLLLALGLQLARRRRHITDSLSQDAARVEELRGVLREAEAIVKSLVERLRDFVSELRPAGLDDFGLTAALEGYVGKLRREAEAGGPEILVELDDFGLDLPFPVAATLFRVAQEALRNALRHAQASRIRIRLDRSPGAVTLLIADNGIGFGLPTIPSTLALTGHFGLIGLVERVKLVGGVATIESGPTLGTTVTVRIPLQQPELTGE